MYYHFETVHILVFIQSIDLSILILECADAEKHYGFIFLFGYVVYKMVSRDLDLDYTEASTFKTVVTDQNLKLFSELDCTRVTVRTQTTILTLPKDLWRTLEEVRHHSLHQNEVKVNNSLLSHPTYFETIERI